MWAGLGLSEQDLAQPPGPQSYPQIFSPNCRRLWTEALTSVPTDVSAQEAWSIAIQTFIAGCRAANTSPFAGLQQSANDRIVTALKTSRRAVLKVMDNARAFDVMTLKNVERSCTVTSQGLVLRVTASILAVDPTVTRWLLRQPWPAFRLKIQGVYRKTLDHNTEMVFFNKGANMPLRWHIGYEIRLPIVPKVPDPERATDRDLANFVLQVLWHQVEISTRTRVWHRGKI